MIVRWSVLAATLVLFGGGTDDFVQQEKQKLQGAWTAVSVSVDGQTNREVPELTLVFAQDVVRVLAEEEEITVAYRLDPSQKPAHLDLVNPQAKKRNYPPWIYEITGDELRIGSGLFTPGTDAYVNDVPRPAFFGAPDSCVLLFRRAKALP